MAQKGHGKLWGVSPLYFSRRLTDRVFRGCRLITPPSLPPSTKPRFLGQKGHCGLAGRCGVVCRSLVRVPDCIFLRPTTWVRDQSCFMLSCFHAHVHAGSTPDRSRDLAGDQRPAEKTEWTVSGEVRETDLFPSCHLSCHRTGYHSPPLSLVKRGKGGNKFGTAPRNFRISQCLSVAVWRALRYDIFRRWWASRRTRYSPPGMRAARLPKAGEGGLEIPLLSLGRSFWKYSGAESGAAEQWSN